LGLLAEATGLGWRDFDYAVKYLLAQTNFHIAVHTPTSENLASFQRHVREIQDSGLVIYTAGFPAPALVQFLQHLDKRLAADCPFYHWGDRDPGGVRIYANIAAAYRRHDVRPHLMSVAVQPSMPWQHDDLRVLKRWASKDDAAGRLACQ
jgi:hypothetical protein